MKKIFYLAIILCAVAFLSACGQQSTTSSSIQKEAQKIQQKVEQANAGIVVPQNLKKCGPAAIYFTEKNEYGMPYDCDHYAQKPVCDYYKRVTGTGNEEIGIAQFDNECAACHWYGSDGILKTGKTTTTDLGYTDGECTQGIYHK